MAVAGAIAGGRAASDADGYLPLEALVAAHARPTASARRVIALLQGWQWVRRVGPGRWVAGGGGADPHRDDRAAFPRDGRCAACTHELAGAYTVAAAGRLVLCASCAGPVRSGVALDDIDAVVAALLGARSADKAARLANRLRERFPELAWEAIRHREGEERVRLGAERAEARRERRYAEPHRWEDALADEKEPDVVPPRRRTGPRSSGDGHLCRACGRVRANERFTGKGHARHVCADCERAERQRRRQRAKARRAAPAQGSQPDAAP